VFWSCLVGKRFSFSLCRFNERVEPWRLTGCLSSSAMAWCSPAATAPRASFSRERMNYLPEESKVVYGWQHSSLSLGENFVGWLNKRPK
jgi:hypothetical protein